MPKLKKEEKQKVKDLINICRIRGLTIDETKIVLDKNTPQNRQVKPITINRYLAQMKEESRDWLLNITKSKFEYVSMLKQRVDELYESRKCLWDTYTNTDDVRAKIAAQAGIVSITEKLLSIYEQLPLLGTALNYDETISLPPSQSSQGEDVY